VVGEDERHAAREFPRVLDVQEFVRAVRVGVRTQHSGDEELGAREALAEHPHEGDGAAAPDVYSALSVHRARGTRDRFLQPWSESRSVPAAIGRWLARIPAIGRQLHVYQLARLYRTTGMLIRGGMPAVPAMRMSAGVVMAGSRAAFAAATRAVSEGQSLAEALERNGLTTPVAARMLRVGERSGNMGEMMERISDFCDEELARWVAVVTRLIEPVLMIVIGLVIGLIVVLMYFPIFQLAGSIQ